MKELRDTNPGIVICLAGNKVDLEKNRVVKTEDAKEFADSNGILFFETSAKTGVNIKEMFDSIGNKTLQKLLI